MIKVFARAARPVLRLLFPRLDPNGRAAHSIVMNMVANFFGMGNAATPLGIKAVGELNALNGKRHTASNEMCMFVVINTASIQLLPTTLISMRQTWGSSNPGAVIVPGVEIGQDSLVAAGTVVTKSVEPFAVVAGNPGRVISDVRRIRSKITGEPVYPWRHHFRKYMPWAESDFLSWYGSLTEEAKEEYHLTDLIEENNP